MATDLIAASDNPVINDAGKAEFGKNHYCLWNTKDGSISTCTIQNLSRANTLTFVVSGAPPAIKTTDGTSFNGQHSIPPNNPTHNVTAFGNFLGTQVTIFNMSSLEAECSVNAVVAS